MSRLSQINLIVIKLIINCNWKDSFHVFFLLFSQQLSKHTDAGHPDSFHIENALETMKQMINILNDSIQSSCKLANNSQFRRSFKRKLVDLLCNKITLLWSRLLLQSFLIFLSLRHQNNFWELIDLLLFFLSIHSFIYLFILFFMQGILKMCLMLKTS